MMGVRKWVGCALAWALAGGGLSPGQAAPLPLETAPAAAAEAPPNLILSLGGAADLGAQGLQPLREALRSAFSADAVPDGSLRLAYQSDSRCRGRADGRCGQPLALRWLDGPERMRFFQWLDSWAPSRSSPAQLLMSEAGRFMRGTGVEGPYAAIPGSAESPLLACRKSYHLLTLAGGWTDEAALGEQAADVGNADGTRRLLPDGVLYEPDGQTEAVTRIFRDGVPLQTGGGQSTLADFAFEHWASDLQPGLGNQVQPRLREPGVLDAGTAAVPFKVPEYWNPKNDPATWQHLSTYTVGFQPQARQASQSERLKGPESEPRHRPWWAGDTWSGDFQALVRGEVGWCHPMFSADTRRGPGAPWRSDGPRLASRCLEQAPVAGRPGSSEARTHARLQDLWHTAINGRGRFIQTTDQAGLTQAFSDILGSMLTGRSDSESVLAASTQVLDAGGMLYVAGHQGRHWAGFLQAVGVDGHGAVRREPLWEAGRGLQDIDPARRLIWTHDGHGGVRFEWDALSDAQRELLKGGAMAANAEGQQRLMYLRGSRAAESQNEGGRLRARQSLLGDIVHSVPWHVGPPGPGLGGAGHQAFVQQHRGRPGMVYVGANDGMLHGFSSLDGRERLAYVPQGAWPRLRDLTEPAPAHTHRYSVDGGLMSGDVFDAGQWKTLLLGTLGRGGRGYFVLDVTSPSRLQDQDPAAQVLLDRSDGLDPDIGHQILEPSLDPALPSRVMQITRLNNGRWAALMGNGVNSRDERAVLLIQYLDGDRALLKLPVGSVAHPLPEASGNGLSNPLPIDFNGDGQVDVVYAGDQLGQLWKFDLSAPSAQDWQQAAPDRPIFVAEDAQGRRQPITAAPVWLPHPYGGVMLGFGTGRLLTPGDRRHAGVQTLYGLWDPARVGVGGPKVQIGPGTPLGAGWRRRLPAPLVAQQRTEALRQGEQTFYRSSRHKVDYRGPVAVRGWYLDLPEPQERVLANGTVLGRLWLQRSLVPAHSDPAQADAPACEAPLREAVGSEYVLDLFSGAPAAWPVFDTDGAGLTGTALTDVSGWRADTPSRLWMRFAGTQVLSVGRGAPMRLRVMGGPSARIGWRQLQ